MKSYYYIYDLCFHLVLPPEIWLYNNYISTFQLTFNTEVCQVNIARPTLLLIVSNKIILFLKYIRSYVPLDGT
uniref:Uncharacterized protein n=1 Tax=Arundo donax TaxID=35708 RepID=A0A0A9B9G3_ARUDO